MYWYSCCRILARLVPRSFIGCYSTQIGCYSTQFSTARSRISVAANRKPFCARWQVSASSEHLAQVLKLSAYALSLKLATSERFFPYNIYPMRTIEIKYAILYLLSRHLMNTIYSTITSVVTFYSPHIPKLSVRTLNIDMARGTSTSNQQWTTRTCI